MKLNCDMGESFGCWVMGNDAEVMPYVDMANIACGFHASDPDQMVATIRLAKQHRVAIGAHPGYDDKQGFGRRSIPHNDDAITHLVAYQIGAIEALCRLESTQIAYVKPHGALYNDMMADESVYRAILRAVAALNCQRAEPLALMVLARRDNRYYQALAMAAGVGLLFEGFADRAYDAEGLLVSRAKPGAVYHDAQRIIHQVSELAGGRLTAVDGSELSLQVDSICVHGDNEQSIAIVRQLAQVVRGDSGDD